jgi:hypothetical protein
VALRADVLCVTGARLGIEFGIERLPQRFTGERYYEGVTHGGMVANLTVYLRKRRPVLDDIDAFIRAQSGTQTVGVRAP